MFKFENLDSTTRNFMEKEFESDVKEQKVYLSNRLTDSGKDRYLELLREAIKNSDSSSLVSNLQSENLFRDQEEYTKRSGERGIRRVPVTTPQTLGEGEFNRYYIRGLCQRAISEDRQDVEIYRAKEVNNPRAESEEMVGTRLNAKKLLEDLRQNIGVDPCLGLPPGPNSGLSVKF